MPGNEKDQKSSAAVVTTPAANANANPNSAPSIFNLQTYLDQIKADNKLAAIDLSQQRTRDAKPKMEAIHEPYPTGTHYNIEAIAKQSNDKFAIAIYSYRPHTWTFFETNGIQPKSVMRYANGTVSRIDGYRNIPIATKADNLKEGTYNTPMGIYEVSMLIGLPDGRLASAGASNMDFDIKIWDTNKQHQYLKPDFHLTGHRSSVYVLTVLRDGRLASGSGGKSIKLWNLNTQKCELTIGGMLSWHGHSEAIYALTELPEEKLASGSGDKTIKIWDTKTGEHVTTLKGHNDLVSTFVVLPGQRLASGSHDQTIKFWNIKTGQCLMTLAAGRPVKTLALLGDGRLVSSQFPTEEEGLDKKSNLKFWDIANGQCLFTLEDVGHSRRSWRVAYTGSPTFIVLQHDRLALLEDSRLVVWNVASVHGLQLQQIEPMLRALQNTSVRQLNLQNSELDDEDVPQLLKLLLQTPLAEVDLRNTRITGDGVRKLFTGLKQHPTLNRIQHDWMPGMTDLVPNKSPSIVLTVAFTINYNDLEMGKELGKGGFGIVYQATWRSAQVAVKKLHVANPSADVLAEFNSETQIMSKLRSPNIVQFYGCTLNPYCIVMEYMPKGSLNSVLHSKENLSWEARYKIAIDIACGLEYLHAENILHRDLKSLNILLDAQYRAKLTDFGLAKVKNETHATTNNGPRAGTLAWMAPELFDADSSYTKGTDIYSLGVVLWEIAARKTPFASVAANALAIPMLITKGVRETIPQDCEPKLASLIQFCWNGDIKQRPTAKQVVDYLRSDAKEFKLTSAAMSPQGTAAATAPPVASTATALKAGEVRPDFKV